VVLSEVLYDQANGQQEFIELFAAVAPVDITGWRLRDNDAGGLALTFAASDPQFPCRFPSSSTPATDWSSGRARERRCVPERRVRSS